MKPADRPLTCDRLREVLSYNRRTGVFRWRIALSRNTHVGDVAGSITEDGYRSIQIDGWRYYANRLAWLYYFGEWPATQLDHRDLDKDNNRLRNLRLASQSQNCANTGLLPTNTTGFKGVTLASANRRRRWKAQIRKDQKRHFLGYFETAEAAYAAYCTAAASMHGAFARVQ